MNSQCEKIGEIVAEYVKLLLPSPQRLPMGIPIVKKCNNRKKESAQGAMGREKSREPRPRFLSFPFPSSPACFLFSFSPVSLRHKGASAEERKVIIHEYI